MGIGITLSPATAFILYLGLTVLFVLGIWLYHHFKTRKKTIFDSEYRLFICEYCHNIYLGRSTQEITQCPKCQLLNKNNTYKTSKN